jgi:hypothetical protein
LDFGEGGNRFNHPRDHGDAGEGEQCLGRSHAAGRPGGEDDGGDSGRGQAILLSDLTI